MDVCNAIDYAHSRGVLHRDIKPGNIIVGKHGETLVVDWGLAKATGKAEAGAEERTLMPSSASGSAETLPGSAMGTPAYMSPEQARGEVDRLGPRSDVYSLGGTLYYLLTGKPSQAGEDVGEVLRRVQHGEFVPPRQIDPSIDKAIEAVCLKAMATQPEDRYASCRSLAEDVERWMADEPISAWREPRTRTLLRWLTRHRTGVTAAAVAGLVALVGTAVVLGVQTSAKTSLERAYNDLAQANERTTKANLQLKGSHAALAQAHTLVKQTNVDLTAANAREADRFRLAMDAIGLFHGEVSKDFLLKEKPFQELRKRLLRGAADFYARLEERLKEQEDHASRAALAKAYEELSRITSVIGSVSDALAVRKKALAIRRELVLRPESADEDRLRLVECLVNTGVILRSNGDPSGAIAVKKEAVGLAEAVHAAAPDSTEPQYVLAKALDTVGYDLSLKEGKPSEALQSHDRALKLLQGLTASEPDNKKYQRELARCEDGREIALGSLNRFEEAVAACQRQVAILENLSDSKDPSSMDDLAQALSNLAGCWGDLNLRNRELEELTRALALWREAYRRFPNGIELRNNLAYCLANRANLLERTGRLTEALEAHREGREILRSLQSEDSGVAPLSNLVRCHWMMGSILLCNGDPTGSSRVFLEGLSWAETWSRRYPADEAARMAVASSRRNVGTALLALSRPSESLDQFRQAEVIDEGLSKADRTMQIHRTALAEDLRCVGQALKRLGDVAGSASAVGRSISLYEEHPSAAQRDPYVVACAHAVRSGLAGKDGSGVSAEEGRAEADKAMRLLHLAIELGYPFPGRLRTEAAFDPIRGRPDFQLLIMDLLFPAEPLSTSH
jgi:tetratricopeptide (TPR) repeat protein